MSLSSERSWTIVHRFREGTEAVEERSTRIHQQPRVVGHWTPWGSVGEDNRSTWRRLARERPTWRKMACVNVDNKARTDTNTGEESQASDIF